MADTDINMTDRSESAAGWAIAAVVVVAIIIGAVLLFQNGLPGVPNTGTIDETNINIPVPTTGTDGTGGAGGSDGTGNDGTMTP
jgi:hypothetical protein